MKVFIVKVGCFVPYRIDRDYRINASSFAVAISRAIKTSKKDPRFARRKIKQMAVSAVMG